MLSTLDLYGVLVRQRTAYDSGIFHWCVEQEAELLMTVKSKQKTLYRLITRLPVRGKALDPFQGNGYWGAQGWHTRWKLRAKEVPELLKAT